MTAMRTFVGIDIAKADVVVTSRPEGGTWTATNNPAGIRTTGARLQAMAPALIVLDATGVYETALVAALVAAALPMVGRGARTSRGTDDPTPAIAGHAHRGTPTARAGSGDDRRDLVRHTRWLERRVAGVDQRSRRHDSAESSLARARGPAPNGP